MRPLRARYKEFVYPVYTCAREAGRYRSIQARHSTRAEKRERRDKVEFKARSGTPSNKQTQPRLDVRREDIRKRTHACLRIRVCVYVVA